MNNRVKLALEDMVDMIKSSQLCMFLAWFDIRIRYRRSKIGPFWITISMAIFIIALGVVYSKLFNVPPEEYLPNLAAGYLFWTLIAVVLSESPTIFIENAAYLKDMKINLLIFVFRSLARNTIIFLHNALFIMFVTFYFGIWPTWQTLLVLPGLILVLLNLFWITLFLGIVGARYRDLAPIIQSMVQVLFFVSPITWLPKLVGANSWVVNYNPIAYFLDLTRSPILNQTPDLNSWMITAGICIAGFAVSILLYAAKRDRIVYWI
ncbi:ABC transporter permease [Gimesia benthica]|jgi:ABC-type polysaccharide/polyol phosphate export permease|uniref:ABC transporter permease n=1 Tax=Gimesia benthica TaxID=2608982 RepID=A0A6I6AGH7_9PLAN|nr:ABC transporter permease [Gimesia benthica]QGQ25186.1 ABC transporter permease [Gimesia benthica]